MSRFEDLEDDFQVAPRPTASRYTTGVNIIREMGTRRSTRFGRNNPYSIKPSLPKLKFLDGKD